MGQRRRAAGGHYRRLIPARERRTARALAMNKRCTACRFALRYRIHPW